MDDKCCGTCKYWEPRNEGTDVGRCTRFPPIVVGPFAEDYPDPHEVAKHTHFPVLSYVCLCGEWVKKSNGALNTTATTARGIK